MLLKNKKEGFLSLCPTKNADVEIVSIARLRYQIHLNYF